MLGKALGFFACASLVGLSLWVAGVGERLPSLAAGTASTEDEVPEASKLTARELFKQGKEEFIQGRYSEAAGTLDAVRQAPGVLNILEKRELENLLRQARIEASRQVRRGAQASLPHDSDEEDNPFAEPKPKARGTKARSTSPAKRATIPANAPPAKKQALALMNEAHELIDEGRLEEARDKVAEAAVLPCKWTLIEETPNQLLTQIERRTGSTRVGKDVKTPVRKPASDIELAAGEESDEGSNVRPAAGTKPAGGANTTKKAQSAKLVAEARKLAANGDYAAAKQLLQEAQALNVAYTLFDERPELVLADITRMEGDSAPVAATKPRATKGAEMDEPLPRSNGRSKTDARKKQATALIAEARRDIQEGRLDEAREKADVAESMNVPYELFEDTPAAINSQVAALESKKFNNVASNDSKEDEGTVATVSSKNAKRRVPTELDDPFAVSGSGEPVNAVAENLGSVRTNKTSARESYDKGMSLLRSGNQEGAYQMFVAAHRSGEKLDPARQQQLQDFLRDLNPHKASKSGIRRVGKTSDEDPLVGDLAKEPKSLDIAEQSHQIQFERLRSETLNAIFRAERLKEKNPDAALEILDRASVGVESSGLADKSVKPLLTQLQRSRMAVEAAKKTREPILANQRNNEETKAIIENQAKTALRIDQEFANLVEEYNKLYKSQQYAEAEVLAKRAKALQPDNPVAVVMEEKAKFGRRIASNEKLRSDKEESFWGQLDDVEQAAIAKVGDKHPVDYGEIKDWKAMSQKRLSKYGRADSRVREAEEERIEKSLSRPITLNFERTPLKEVIAHISTAADINVMLDSLGLEEEGVSTDTPISINVEGIKLKSALNLLLEPLRLSYTIEDEVLKITSRLKQQGKLIVTTYPVADLVVPIPNFTPSSIIAGTGTASPTGWGGPGAQFNVGGRGAAQFQVGDPVGALGGAANWSGPQSSGGANVTGASNTATADFDGLSQLIVSTVEPDSWDEVGGAGSVRPFETTLSLVIRQTQKVHEEIADLLSQLRRLQDLQVTIEVRFITVSDRFFERIGVDFDFNVQDNVEGDTTGMPAFGTPILGTFAAAFAQTQTTTTTTTTTQTQTTTTTTTTTTTQTQTTTTTGGGANGLQPNPLSIIQRPARDNWPKSGTIAGLTDASGNFTQDLDVQFRQGSFDIGVPSFGDFQPTAGIQVGMAILSDIEAFFFINAAQGDKRTNLVFAPKVTLFNGQQATVENNRLRPFVTSLAPTVGFFSVGFQPIINVIPEGVTLTVQAVISADRRYVRLTVIPLFSSIADVFTFTFQGGTGQNGQQGLGQQQQQTGVSGQSPFGGGGGQQGSGSFFSVPDEVGYSAGLGGGGANAKELLMRALTSQTTTTTTQTQTQTQTTTQQGNFLGTQTVQQPVVDRVSVTTTVSVPDGGTVLLGGVKRLRESRNMAGVPILNKLPYISRLFKNSGVGRETESLLLMVTPRIIIQEEEEELLGIPATAN